MLTTLTPTELISAKLHSLFQRDRQLREAIASYRLVSDILVFTVRVEKMNGFYNKLGRILRLLWLCGSQIKSILVNGASLSVANLLSLQPSLTRIKVGPTDKKLEMAIARQNYQRYRAMLGFTATEGTVFVIGTDGIYKEVEIHMGTESRIPPESMIGRSLSEVLSDNPDSAKYILSQIQEAYASGIPRRIEYGLWERQYETDIVPIANMNECLLICRRTL